MVREEWSCKAWKDILSNRVQERRHRKEQDPYQLVISINKSLSLGKTSATT